MASNSEVVRCLKATLGKPLPCKPWSVRTLVADDTPDYLQVVCACLHRWSSIEIVGTATDGAGAICAAEQLRPDLVIMDTTMPGINGLQATIRLRRKFPNLRILMMSADDDSDLVLASHECGANGFVWKGELHEQLASRLLELFPEHMTTTGECTQNQQHASQELEDSVYRLHSDKYEHYRNLLELAQELGNRSVAKDAARMLLVQLRNLFQSLPADKRRAVKSEMVAE